MFKSHFRIAWRNLGRNKGSTIINISGLSIGMAVTILISLWIYNEWSFDKQFKGYDRIAQVMENQAINGVFQTQKQIPIPVAAALLSKYGSDFREVVLSTQTEDHILAFGDRKLTKSGNFIQPQAPAMFSMQMLEGSLGGLKDPHSILISSSASKALFGDADPLERTIKMDDSIPLRVAGVFNDFPANSTFHNITFLAPWDLFASVDPETKASLHEWEDNNWQVFVQLSDKVDITRVSESIKYVKADNDPTVKAYHVVRPELFLHPMSRWHLYSQFTDGVSTGGRIVYVRLFGVIGLFVLLLACINFMNLSTARSEKRAREVGIRKTIGSLRGQLIAQFFGESLMITALSFLLSLVFLQIALPFFNLLAGEQIRVPWLNPLLWISGLGFSLVTGIISGSYPALYLSSFQAINVLKGVFRAGRKASFLRRALVVTQFTISIALIIGTIIVFRQIQFARNRPVGYIRDGLFMVQLHTRNIHDHFAAFRNDLLGTGAISEVAESTSPTTEMGDENGGLSWTGKAMGTTSDNFAMKGVTQEYAQTVGLQFTKGRNFRTGPSGYDAMTMILSESTVRHMGFDDPIGKTVVWQGYKFTVIGVVNDIVMESPYETSVPTIYYIAPYPIYTLNVRINPNMNPEDAVARIGAVFSKYNPAEPFNYKFVDAEYAAKFEAEEKIGKLAGFFAALAIFISCLGLFGLASYVAEQRTKEIGVRKVLGATVFGIWKMLSRDFLLLVLLSCFMAIPIAWYGLSRWLQHYAYHTPIEWWVFVSAGMGAIVITLVTVSQQAVKAALANPVKSLRTE